MIGWLSMAMCVRCSSLYRFWSENPVREDGHCPLSVFTVGLPRSLAGFWRSAAGFRHGSGCFRSAPSS
jgi:hypothetical protein